MNSGGESLFLPDDLAVQRARRLYGRHLWDNDLKPELIKQLPGLTSVG